MKNLLVIILIAVIAIMLIAGLLGESENNISTIQKDQQSVTLGDEEARMSYESIKSGIRAHEYVCFGSSKVRCADSNCEQLEPITFFTISGEQNSRIINRCDYAGCDEYETMSGTSGIFEYISYPSHQPSTIFKKANQTEMENQFIDVATVVLDTVITTGQCEGA